MSLAFFGPELVLFLGAVIIVIFGLIWKDKPVIHHVTALTVFIITCALSVMLFQRSEMFTTLFTGSLRINAFSSFLKILFSVSALLTVVMTWSERPGRSALSEYYIMLIIVVLGANLLVSSENFLMAFLSLEVISIGSYILTAFSFNKKATEGSLKYFIFGSVASAVMLYGFSLLYGMTGTLSFTSIEFIQALSLSEPGLLFIAGTFSLAGFLYKIAAAPMHPWAPDVYEAAPMPIVAFFSVVPKLAGIGVLAKFIVALSLIEQSPVDWQLVLCGITILTLTVGNFSALWQKNVKRLMAYSSVGQSGFLLIAVLVLSEQGLQFLLFYGTVYVMLNFLVFIYLQYFENGGFTTIAAYVGSGKTYLWPAIFLLVGFIGLTGLPPTAGFTGKLFIFSALWDSYSVSHKPILLWLLVFGLLNTVVSLFYYLRIPYYAFIKQGDSPKQGNNLISLNLLGGILVLLVLLLFFSPGLLMGWINKTNFVF